MNRIESNSYRKKSCREIVVIEPKTRITSLNTLGYYTSLEVTGAIAGILFGKDEEKKEFSVISEFADIEDYFLGFRYEMK